MDYLEEKDWGKRVVTYHLRDWIFSRQRYWGEPIPMVDCKKCGWVPLPESELPLKLPYVKSYEPTGTGESPLAKIKDWVNTKCPKCEGPAKRETDTMPNWAGSCWYFIAFAFWNQGKVNPKFKTLNSKQYQNSNDRNTKHFENLNLEHSDLFRVWDLEFRVLMQRWLPADWYLGGAEHAVLHLLYSRFWVKALYDLKLLNFKEPFLRLRNLGMVLAEDRRKMSKSFDNIINPDEVIKEYGADALRLYEMFMAPFDKEVFWSTSSLQGSYRFISRVWKMFQSYNNNSATQFLSHESLPAKTRALESEKIAFASLIYKLNKTIIKVTQDIQEVKFNTAIAAMMEFLNEWERKFKISNFKFQILSKKHAQDFLKVLAPFAPFTTEEIWGTVFGEKESIHLSKWPKVDPDLIGIDEEVTIPVQVNGKLRATIKVQSSKCRVQSYVVEQAIKEERVKKYLEGKKYKVIYIKGKILNFVI